MSPEERQLLTSLFERVKTASATPRDHDAETLVDQSTREQPYAAYYLAQAVIIQEKGLEAAAARIKELEDHVRQLEESQAAAPPRAEQSGGFLSSIFGSGQTQPAPAPRPAPALAAYGSQSSVPASGPWGSAPRQAAPQQGGYDDYRGAPPPQQQQFGQQPGPWGGQQQAAPSAGGSFLRGALGTAAGVAGGMMLANSLSGLLGSHAPSLGLGTPAAGANIQPPIAPVEETVINNNYYGDSGPQQVASKDDSPSNDQGGNDGGWQQADYSNDDQSGGGSDFGYDDTLDA